MALGPTQPPIQWVPGAVPLGLKQLGREADHSPPSSAEVRMRGAIPLLPQYIFMAWCLVKHRDNFTFTFYYFADCLILSSQDTYIKESKTFQNNDLESITEILKLLSSNLIMANFHSCKSVFNTTQT
jgi:hypothetical protein